MLTSDRTPVLVVGAGPVGCVLALELARHGVESLLLERTSEPSRHPKMDYLNGRTMELLHRLDLADEIRTRGVPADHRADFCWTLGLAEEPVAVWRHPSVNELTARLAEVNDGTAPSQVYHRVHGSLLEALLRRRVRRDPLVDLREGWTFEDLRQDDGGVVASARHGDTGLRHDIRAGVVAACDGARSAVRRCTGIDMETVGPTTRHCSVYFRSADPVLRAHGRAFVTVGARGATLVSRDGDVTWSASIPLGDGDPLPTDPLMAVRRRLGVEFGVDEVLSVAQWEGSLSVAGAYRDGAVFLAGDSAHSFYPTGGHGANTGLADAVDLGWKLSAVVNGWGGPTLLDSYEAERRPVALFNREMCANLLEVWRRFGGLAREGAPREYLAGFLAEETYQLDNAGVHFGYRYGGSPVVHPEDGAAPAWRWDGIVPTTWPGSRAPSLRLPNGRQLFDTFGREFTLVDLSGTGKAENLTKEAQALGVPVTGLVVDDEAVRAAWERELVLVRPDQHVAWRGNEPPDDWESVLDLVRGARPAAGGAGGMR